MVSVSCVTFLFFIFFNHSFHASGTIELQYCESFTVICVLVSNFIP